MVPFEIQKKHEELLTKWAFDTAEDCPGNTTAEILSVVCGLLTDQLIQILVKAGCTEEEFVATQQRLFRLAQQHLMECDCPTCVNWRAVKNPGELD